MSSARISICDGCGYEERHEWYGDRSEGWSKIEKEDLCPTCTKGLQEWRAQRAAGEGSSS